MAIKNIIFDYGGVIIDLDFNRTKTAFENLGVKNFEEHFSQLQQTPVFDLFDRGKISEREFRSQLNAQTGLQLSDADIDAAWNAMLIGVKEEKFPILSHAQANFRTFLLSNTNYIHLKAITKNLIRAHGRANLDGLFDKVYYSCSVGLRKPDPEIYQKLIDDNDLKPAETLFIDDSPQHIEGANRAGFHTFLFQSGNDLAKIIEAASHDDNGGHAAPLG